MPKYRPIDQSITEETSPVTLRLLEFTNYRRNLSPTQHLPCTVSSHTPGQFGKLIFQASFIRLSEFKSTLGIDFTITLSVT